MISRKFYTGIVIRVTLIVFTSLTLAFFSFKTNYFYTISALLVLVSCQTWLLIRYIIRKGHEIKRMLEYIKENNPTIYFSQSGSYPFSELGSFLNEIGDIVREVRIEKENQFQYMQYIVQHVAIGLFSFDSGGKIEIINQAAKDLLGAGEISSINSLEQVQPGLPSLLRGMRPGEGRVIILKSKDRLFHLAVRISVFRIGTKEIRLVSLQDIKSELDEKEMDSWQKLIRVLTHEIVNSVTSVTSVISTISGFFKREGKAIAPGELTSESIKEALDGLSYMEERGNNLVEFVKKFRSLTKLPSPKFEDIKLATLLSGIVLLKRNEITEKGIKLECSITPDDLTICCDRGLTENMLLNLVNNSIDAVGHNAEPATGLIEVKGFYSDDRRPVVTISDNGSGIPDEIIDKIFIPFFTTKEHGSGIGLSISRQIMQMHGGTISVYSYPQKQTVFVLNF